MDNNKLKTQLSLVMIILICIGCNYRRSLGTDPALSPVIVPVELKYDAQNPRVVLNWEYLGVEPPVRFRLKRFERETVHLFDWQSFPPPSRPVSEDADVWDLGPIVDARINSGESYLYFMHTETEGAKKFIEGHVGSIQIPGAHLSFINLQSEKSTAKIDWFAPSTTPIQYELFRQTDDEPSISIFQSQNSKAISFEDLLPEGNRTYTYTLRNFWGQNLFLDSRKMSLKAYPRDLEFGAYTSLNGHIKLAPVSPEGTSIFTLSKTPNAIAVQTLEQINNEAILDPLAAQVLEELNNDLINPREIQVPNQSQLNPESLSIGIAPNGTYSLSFILAGILKETNQVQLSSHFNFSNQFADTEWEYLPWSVDNPNAATTVAVRSNGHIFVGAGKTLSLSTIQGNTIKEQAQFDLNLSRNIHSLTVVKSAVWVVTTDGQLFRSTPVEIILGTVTPPTLIPVMLPSNAKPIAVTSDQRAIFVLDQAQNRVLVFDPEGTPGLWWRGFDDLDLSKGGLAISQTSDIYVWDAQNRIVRFRNAPAFLNAIEEISNEMETQ